MTEVAIHQPTDIANTAPTGPMTEGLDVWAARLADAAKIGTALCKTAFVPKDFQGKPEEAAAAILYGHSIGFDPMQSLQGIHVISGRPSLAARAMVALLISHGHEIWTSEKNDNSVTVHGRRRETGREYAETWDTARAEKAGYGKKEKYLTDPQAMLYARAASGVCRQMAPDVLAGLAYSQEEMDLVTDRPVSPPATAARPTIRQAAAAVTTQAAVTVDTSTGEVLDGEVVEDAPGEAIATLEQLHDIARVLDCPREQILAEISARIGRQLGSSKELTAAEAQSILDMFGDVDPTADPSWEAAA